MIGYKCFWGKVLDSDSDSDSVLIYLEINPENSVIYYWFVAL